MAVPYIDGELKFFDMGRDVGFLDNRARDGYWYAYYTSNETALDGKPGVDVRRAKADIDSGTRFRWRCVIGLL